MNNHKAPHAFIAFVLILAVTLACKTLIPSGVTQTPVTTSENPTPTSSTSSNPDAGSSGMGDSLYPDFGNGGYDVQSYILDITITDVKTSDLHAITSIKDSIGTEDLERSFFADIVGAQIRNSRSHQGRL